MDLNSDTSSDEEDSTAVAHAAVGLSTTRQPSASRKRAASGPNDEAWRRRSCRPQRSSEIYEAEPATNPRILHAAAREACEEVSVGLGSLVKVYWSGERRWYQGLVDETREDRNGKRMHHVSYEDGDTKWHHLPSVEWLHVKSTDEEAPLAPQESVPVTLQQPRDAAVAPAAATVAQQATASPPPAEAPTSEPCTRTSDHEPRARGQGGKPFTTAEEAELRRGVGVHGNGAWAAILRTGSFAAQRTNVDLKDKWRNMVRAGEPMPADALPPPSDKLPPNSMPPGWSVDPRETATGRKYKVYSKPGESNMYSLKQAWQRHLEAGGRLEQEEQEDEEEEDEWLQDWTELEVDSGELVEEHLRVAALVGSDVCVLPLAFPGFELKKPGAIGWRGLVTSKRGGGKAVQVQVFGAWFELRDERRISAIEQVEGEGEKEEREEGEESEEPWEPKTAKKAAQSDGPYQVARTPPGVPTTTLAPSAAVQCQDVGQCHQDSIV